MTPTKLAAKKRRKQRKSRYRKRLRDNYLIRFLALKELGFSSYAEYLQSDLWATIRARVLDRDNHTCVFCSKPARQVHHRRYGVHILAGRDLMPLKSLCGK